MQTFLQTLPISSAQSIRSSSQCIYEAVRRSWAGWCESHGVVQDAPSDAGLVHYLWHLFYYCSLAVATPGASFCCFFFSWHARFRTCVFSPSAKVHACSVFDSAPISQSDRFFVGHGTCFTAFKWLGSSCISFIETFDALYLYAHSDFLM